MLREGPCPNPFPHRTEYMHLHWYLKASWLKTSTLDKRVHMKVRHHYVCKLELHSYVSSTRKYWCADQQDITMAVLFILTQFSISDAHVALQEIVYFSYCLLLKFCWLKINQN